MKNLSSVQCGIKALEGVLNRMVDGVNQRTPRPGAGIVISESDDGVVIGLGKKADDDQGQNAAGQQQPAALGQNKIRIYDVSFFAAQVVDPSTCQATFVQVLIQDPGGWADFNIWLGPNAPDTWGG